MRDRTFGVEIEHGNRAIGVEGVRRRLRERFPQLFDPQVYPRHHMSVGEDGSGVEVRTPPLKGAAGFRTLRAVFEYLTEIGGYTTNSDGMHVHFGAPELVEDPRKALLLAKNWASNEALIESFVARHRGGAAACPRTWGPNTTASSAGAWGFAANQPRLFSNAVEEMARRIGHGMPLSQVVDAQPHRGALNLRALNEHGTVEIRLHEGTLDPDVAEAWIRFCVKFINAAAEGREIRSCPTPDDLFRRVPTYNRARKQLKSRALAVA